MIQTKLEIDQPGDIYEREADHVAERVMRTPEPLIQRTPGGGYPRWQAQTVAPPIVHEVLRSPGQPLDPATRAFMEPRLGHDFGQVRVHTDARASESARLIGARAYTVGQHIAFGAGQFAPGEERSRALLAHELTHVVQQSGADGKGVLQRQPSPPEHIEMPAEYAFVDERRRTDKGYARSLGQKDAARIRKAGRLSPEDREEVRAKLRFFEGNAWVVYEGLIKPALVEVTREVIEMPEDPARPIEPGAELARFTAQANYIDNNIKMVSFFTAESAIIHYRDGSKLELGLVPRWMKPPVEEVDYHTPREQLRLRHDAKEGISFIKESDLRNVPRGMSWAEVQKRYARPVGFFPQPGTSRIVPSRVNMLTAPTLCRLLLDSEKKFVEQTQWAAEWGTEVAKATGAMGGGGFAGGTGSQITRRVAPRAGSMAATTPAAKKLALEMDNLLAAGGSKTINVEGVVFDTVTVARQGSRLNVSRFGIGRAAAPPVPGHSDVMRRAFEDAAVQVARTNGLKTVNINVGVIVNPGWREWLESIGYVFNRAEGAWIKTIKL